jgi:hypothetical protein
MSSAKLLVWIIPFSLLTLAGASADGVIVVLKNSSAVERRDAANGHYLGTINVTNAVRADTDGETIAIQLADGTIRRHEAKNGQFMGLVGNAYRGRQEISSMSVTNGVVVVVVGRTAYRFKARTGQFMGSSQM